MPGKEYDALVIGSGAAGSFAVKELTERGMEVLLLEAGPDITPDDFKNPPAEKPKGMNLKERLIAGMQGQHIQARVAFFGNQFKPFFVNDWQNPYTTPADDFFLWIRGRQLGGRLHTYGRVLLRMSDCDFKAATRDGFGEDWPISYADIAPCYEAVEEFLGVYGTEDHIPNLPDGKYSNTPKLTAAERAFKASVESRWPDRHVTSWRYAAPNPARVPQPILAARATGRLTTRTDAVVRRITTDPVTGQATGAEFTDRVTKKTETARARVVVVCASAIESARLLLNSASPKHPDGLGNSSGTLGRYFMDQCPSLLFGSVPHIKGWELDDSAPPDPFYVPSGGFYIPRFQNIDTVTNPGFQRGFGFQGTVGRGFVPDGSPAMFGMMGFGETLPYAENSITINPRKRDAWGIPVPHIECRLRDNERALLTEQTRAAREMADEFGCRIDFSGNTFGLENEKEAYKDADIFSRFLFRKSFRKSMAVGAAIHECGGVRMGQDPAKSILNPFNQCWDAKNVFVTDASAFPSSGTVGPTLTIMAMTVRACEYIAQECKTGRL